MKLSQVSGYQNEFSSTGLPGYEQVVGADWCSGPLEESANIAGMPRILQVEFKKRNA